ncbi:MAG TPA: VOC family protein [Candidatus Pacearchaeota archaeon]|jgi:methylmalonyl-CoA/ethylmalonyl-CoA epimerase|nr:VOC family protein [Candidatus Pacearchaeota archaeon]
MKVHHIGYAVKNLDEAFNIFKLLGFEKENEKVIDDKRNVKILFIHNREYRIELIESLGENSPIRNILKKSGSTPYHLCYESENILEDIELLKNNNFILISELSESRAINDKKVCFLYNKQIGIIELVEKI